MAPAQAMAAADAPNNPPGDALKGSLAIPPSHTMERRRRYHSNVSNPDLIDIGSNLAHASFDPDRDAVIERARAAGVSRQIVTGPDLPGSHGAALLAASRPGTLWSTAGVHPHYASGFHSAQRGELESLLRLPQVVAVGECGLDYCRNFSPRGAQIDAFVAQLEIAAAHRKPVFLHQRDAHADFIAILRDFAPRIPRGVAHCFTDGERELEDCLSLGLSVGITGWICDERRGSHLRGLVRRIPADRLMLETDAPYLLPRDLSPRPRSRRNEPMYLGHIAQVVAKARGESPAALAASTTANAEAFFGLTSSGAAP
jgi:TatD DNase family protein